MDNNTKCPEGNTSTWVNPRTNDAVCEEEKCQTCCPHDEFDHYICLDCGYEKCPGEDIDAVMDYFEDR